MWLPVLAPMIFHGYWLRRHLYKVYLNFENLLEVYFITIVEAKMTIPVRSDRR